MYVNPLCFYTLTSICDEYNPCKRILHLTVQLTYIMHNKQKCQHNFKKRLQIVSHLSIIIQSQAELRPIGCTVLQNHSLNYNTLHNQETIIPVVFLWTNYEHNFILMFDSSVQDFYKVLAISNHIAFLTLVHLLHLVKHMVSSTVYPIYSDYLSLTLT